MADLQNNTQKTSKKLGSKHNPISADQAIDDFNQVNHIRVTDNQNEQRLDNFLLARLKGLPKSHLYKLIRADEVRINGKRCKPHDKLYSGDIIRLAPVKIATREKLVISTDFAQGLLDRVVYEDEGLLVLNKPSGMAVHGGSGENFGVIEAMREATGKNYLELIHRIDKDTSGLLMISKKRSTLKKLQQYLREKTIQKHYLCLVAGHVVMDKQHIDAPLRRYTLASGERRVKVDNTPDNTANSPHATQGSTKHNDRHSDKHNNRHNKKEQSKAEQNKQEQSKPSQTDIIVKDRFIYNGQKVSLVQAMPRTGRTHQIRVHMAHIGHPLLGDDKYNLQDQSAVRRLCLHAWQLEIPQYPLIETNLPEDMAVVLKALD